MMTLSALKEMADQCVQCGMCQSVCPVFAELQKEGAVARGKVSLIVKLLSGELGHSEKLSTYLLQCLGCGACSENCANGVKADELILAARALMVEKKGLSLPKRLIFRTLLDSVSLLPNLLKAGSLLQGLALKRIPKESGLHLRFSLPYLDRRRLIPPVARPFLLDRFPETIDPPQAKGRVGLFAGCSIQYLFPSVGESTLRLLGRNHYAVRLPKGQGCCGLPAYGSGDIETAKSLARRNIRAFAGSEIDRLIVPCASCFYYLKEGYAKLFPGDEKVHEFCEKVTEPSTFFLELFDAISSPSSPESDRSSQERKLRVTYHDSCHLRRGMKIYRQPRRLLAALPGTELVEMRQPARCCGMGGSFNFIYYDLSRKILQRKLDDIRTTGADFVVTSCMGCMIQLTDGLSQEGMKTRAVHLVEILEKGNGLFPSAQDGPGH